MESRHPILCVASMGAFRASEYVASRLRRRGRRAEIQAVSVEEQPEAPPLVPLDGYVSEAPSRQSALDLFAGEWVSAMPAELELRAGSVPLFEDDRINWLDEEVGGVAGRRVLELGPLEGGHSYMLERLGAERVLAIEANRRSYMKCLIAKETLGMERVKFLCGDLVGFLRDTQEEFDLCVASGVLYHMREPIEMLSLAADVADSLFLWTHYHDVDVINSNSGLAGKFGPETEVTFDDTSYALHRYEYGAVRAAPSFCGGSAAFSYWLERDGIITALRRFGFNRLTFGFDDPHHANGPSLAVLARR